MESVKYGHSLNKERRKRELQKITQQNKQILKTIQQAQPTYDHRAWEEQAKTNDEVLMNICEFKPKHLKSKSLSCFKKLNERNLINYEDFYD